MVEKGAGQCFFTSKHLSRFLLWHLAPIHSGNSIPTLSLTNPTDQYRFRPSIYRIRCVFPPSRESSLMKQVTERACRSLLFLPLIAAFLLSGCEKSGSAQSAAASAARPPAPVVVARVEQRDIPVQIQAIGNVEAYQMVQIRSQVNGQIQQIFFKEGEDVRQGQPLFQLDQRPFQADLEKATEPDEARSGAGREFANAGGSLLRLGKARHRLP